MPRLNIGQHLGVHAGSMGIPLDQAEKEFRETENPSPYDIGEFRTGYIIGQINARLNYLRSWQPYLDRQKLEEMLEDIMPIVQKWGYGEEDKEND